MKAIYQISDGSVVAFCPGPIPPVQDPAFSIHALNKAETELFQANTGAKFSLLNGALTVTEPATAPVPKEVPLWAFREILLTDGLMDTVNATIQAIPDPVTKARLENFMEYGNVVLRASPGLQWLANMMAKTPAEIDDVFRRAGVRSL